MSPRRSATTPDCHWIKIRTNNPLARSSASFARSGDERAWSGHSRTVSLNLAEAWLRHVAGTQRSTRKHMNMAPLRAAKNEAYGAVSA
jgi:hypothetical protein